MIRVESTDGIALVRFERPPANAIELESAVALEETLARLEADAETRAVVLTGHGEFFSAGLDLKVVPTYGPEQQRTMVMAINRLLGRLYGLGLTETRAAVPYPLAAMTVVTAELAPAVARRRVLLARNGTPDDALAEGILDELVAGESVLARAVEVARELAALPRLAYARIKRQLRSRSLERIAQALASGTDPLLEEWLAPETAAAAADVLRRPG